MKQEDSDLLFGDLCSRLPYGVKLLVPSWDEQEMEYIDKVDTLYSINGDKYIKTANEDYDFNLEDVKPYLFPLSSMTEEQKKYLHDKLIELELKALNDEISRIEAVSFEMGFYHKNYIDYRGLIPMGLALDATGKNIY